MPTQVIWDVLCRKRTADTLWRQRKSLFKSGVSRDGSDTTRRSHGDAGNNWRVTQEKCGGELLKNDCFGLEGSGLGSGWLLQVNRWPSAARRSTCHCCQVSYCTWSSDSLLCAVSPVTAAGIFALGLQRSLWHSHQVSHKIAESLHDVVWNYGIQWVYKYGLFSVMRTNWLVLNFITACVWLCQDFQDSVT